MIDAARYAFAHKGFHQTCVAELAEQAEISIGQIYRLFESKSELIIAIVREDLDYRLAVMEEIAAKVGRGSLPILAALERIVADSLNGGNDPLILEILAEACRNDAVATVVRSLTARCRCILRSMALHANDRLTGDRLVAAEEVLLSSLFGLGNRVLSSTILPPDRKARLAADFLLAALQ